VNDRTPFPEIDTTEASGYEWLGRFMEAQASFAGNSLFATFKLGQLGIAGKFNPVLARAMLDDLRTDRADLEFSSKQLLAVMDGLIENIERNLDEGSAS
jgi:hypothetical protein